MTTPFDDYEVRIRSVIEEHSGLPVHSLPISNNGSLYDAGMTSHAMVNVMLALEGEFDAEFPDDMLNRHVFASVASIRDALVTIVGS